MTLDRDEMAEIGHELSDLSTVLTAAEGNVVGNVSAQSALGLAARICWRLGGQLLDAVDADVEASK